MNKKAFAILGVVVVVIVVSVIFSKFNNEKTNLVPIRIGWQVAWMPQAQITEILKNTNILEKNNLIPTFQKFTAGPPLTEAALAGSLDVIFVGYVPALSLTSKSDNWKIVSRLSDTRAAIIVPKDSEVKTISDLKGKIFAVPFATLPHILGIKGLTDAGLDPSKEVTVKNIDAVEGANVIQKGTAKSWGSMDAFGTWDPNLFKFEDSGKARIISLFPLNGVVVMSKDFYTNHPKEASNFLKSIIQSYEYYIKNKEQVDNWYLTDTGMTYSPAVIAKTISAERNMVSEKITDIHLVLNSNDLADIQKQADQGFAMDVLKKKIITSDVIDQSFVEKAESEILSGKYTETIVPNK